MDNPAKEVSEIITGIKNFLFNMRNSFIPKDLGIVLPYEPGKESDEVKMYKRHIANQVYTDNKTVLKFINTLLIMVLVVGIISATGDSNIVMKYLKNIILILLIVVTFSLSYILNKKTTYLEDKYNLK